MSEELAATRSWPRPQSCRSVSSESELGEAARGGRSRSETNAPRTHASTRKPSASKYSKRWSRALAESVRGRLPKIDARGRASPVLDKSRPCGRSPASLQVVLSDERFHEVLAASPHTRRSSRRVAISTSASACCPRYTVGVYHGGVENDRSVSQTSRLLAKTEFSFS